MVVDRRLLLMTTAATLFASAGAAGWLWLKALHHKRPSAETVAREMRAGETSELAGLTLSRSEHRWLSQSAPGVANPKEIIDLLRGD